MKLTAIKLSGDRDDSIQLDGLDEGSYCGTWYDRRTFTEAVRDMIDEGYDAWDAAELLLIQSITHAKENSPMEREEADELVAYLKTLFPKFEVTTHPDLLDQEWWVVSLTDPVSGATTTFENQRAAEGALPLLYGDSLSRG